MDGTLIDSMPALTGLAIDVLCRYYSLSYEEAKEQYLSTIGIPFNQQLDKIFGFKKQNIAAEEEYLLRKRTLTLEAKIFKNVALEFAGSLLTTGVVSSTESYLVRQVIDKHFLDRFNWVSGVGDLYGNKPNQIDAFLQYYGLSTEEVVYYGDSEYDQQIAQEFGMSFVKVNPDGSLEKLSPVL